jgi:branched-chain amino acid transport system substrate-binding protein
MKQMGVLGALVIVVTLILVWHSALPHTGRSATEPFVIGGLLPLTGDLAGFSQEINRGAILAIENAEASGTPVTYDPEDDAFDPKQMVTAATKLLNIDGAAAVFTAVGEEAKPVNTLFNQSKVPLLVAWDSNAQLKQAGPYIFSIGFSTEKDGALMADYAYDTLKLRKIAVVAAIDPVMDIMAPAFVAEFESRGGTVIAKEEVQPDESDFRTVIAKVESAKPDGIYMGLIPPENATFLPQLRQTNFSGAALSADGLIQSDIAAAGTAANGVYYTNIFANHPDTIAGLYQARFGSAPFDTSLVSFGYDSVETLLAAHDIATQKDIPLRDALTQVKISGLGTDIDMNGTQFSERVERVFHIENGQSVPVQ